MKVEYIGAYINAAIKTFSVSMNIDIVPKVPLLIEVEPILLEIGSFITFHKVAYGSLVLTTNRSSAFEFTRAFVSADQIEQQDMEDVIREISNIIAGNANAGYPVQGIEISVPSIMVKETLTQAFQSRVNYVGTEFTTPFGPLYLYVGIEDIVI